MAIRFHCDHCNQLMSIASRQAGRMVPCPVCGRNVVVPDEDPLSPAEPARSLPVPPDEATRRHDDPPRKPAPPAQDRPSPEPRPPRQKRHDDAPPAGEYGETESDEENLFVLRSVKSEFGEMDLTPMVDVTFLLLIFFMVTASFTLQKSIEVPTPDPDQEGATQSIQTPEDLQENSIIVQIDERDVISVDFKPVADPENLAELLADLRRSERKSELVIDADEQAKHGTVVFVNDAAVEADFQRIRLAVRVPGG